MDSNNNSYRYSSRNYKDSFTCKPGWEVKVCSQTSCAFSHLGNQIINLVKLINIYTLKFENRLHLINKFMYNQTKHKEREHFCMHC